MYIFNIHPGVETHLTCEAQSSENWIKRRDYLEDNRLDVPLV